MQECRVVILASRYGLVYAELATRFYHIRWPAVSLHYEVIFGKQQEKVLHIATRGTRDF